jgi:DNA-binding CsgD family transcriptional regulator
LLHGARTSDADLSVAGKSKPVAEGAQPLSNRELEVMLLVAHGRTNEEIGVTLGISKKTAQHHIAHAYEKLGVSGRVGATVWLMEHGLLGN